MLFALTDLAIQLPTALATGLSDGLAEAPLHSGSPTVTPQDPSTLVLALIGVGTIAIYAAARWRPSRFELRRWTGRISDESEFGEPIANEERSSRGAA